MTDKLHIAYTTSAGYFLQTEVAAASAVALASRRADIVIHIFDCGIPDDKWIAFERRMRSHFGGDFGLVRHCIDITPYTHLRAWHGSYASYVRIETAELVRDADWALFADGDTLFLSDPLRINDSRDNSMALIGNADCYGSGQPVWWKEHGFDWDAQKHVCVGFAMKNLKWMREAHVWEKCLKLLNDYPDIPNIDQDVLNITCAGKIAFLPKGWGEFDFAAMAESAFSGAIHYVSIKPWNRSIEGHIPIPTLSRIWFAALKMFVGMNPWEVMHVSRLEYYKLSCKSWFFAAMFKVLNRVPGIKGRYDQTLRSCWGVHALRRATEAFNRSLNKSSK